ncbi:Fc receptor-like protein 2 [Hemibagrus wyckioides]|uniref:Fc receptor-like protein 2 n=1 Tax=Hemibagrus wyckioides TaxID=337641 RepID=UPI00266DCFE8|nr:Fc receptor-like protein 2 [Hemibagrus wyckioides]
MRKWTRISYSNKRVQTFNNIQLINIFMSCSVSVSFLVLISLIPVAQAQGSPKAVVSIKPDTHVFIGEIVTVRCDIQGGGDTQGTYSWKLINSEDGRERFSTDNTKQVVKIQSVKDSGTYTCSIKGRDSQSSEISDAVTLTVSGSPKAVVSIIPDTHVFIGETVTLRCDIQGGGDTQWTYSWKKNNYRFTEGGERFSTDSTMQEFKISSVNDSDSGTYTCRGHGRDSQSSEISDAVTLTVSERPQAVLSVSPQSWLTEGDSVTLSCEVTDSSTDWTFSWYTVVPYRDGLTGINNNGGYSVYVELLSDSSRGSGGNYTLSPAALKHTGVYMCRGERGEPALHSQYSNPQPLWITGESPPVSLIINPSRTQHFTKDSLSLSCEDQSNSTGWTVRRYTHSERVLDCSHWGSVTGSTCNISFLSTSYTGAYWCESESGENSNPVHITVHDGDVILESPVHPVTEGHPLTLHCLYHNPNPSNLRADFYKDGSVLQNQTTGEMIIQTVSKSDEGFYHCKHPERGESPKSWISVTRHRSSGLTVGLVVGLGFFFIALLILVILLWSCKRKKEKQQKTNQTSDQNQIRSGAEDSQSGHTPLQAESAIYANVDDVTIYANELCRSGKEKASVTDDTVYSELKRNME